MLLRSKQLVTKCPHAQLVLLVHHCQMEIWSTLGAQISIDHADIPETSRRILLGLRTASLHINMELNAYHDTRHIGELESTVDALMAFERSAGQKWSVRVMVDLTGST